MKKKLERVKIQKDFSTMVRDQEGEDRVKKMGKELKAKNQKYVDPEFTANDSMLFVHPSSPPPFLQAIDEVLKKKEIKWLRPEEIGDPNEKPQVFADGIDPEDIHQGAIGDCYFLAALAICATREELINDLIVEDFAEQGIYGVKFYSEGSWSTVIVDDLFPCWKINDSWIPIFSRWKGKKETWAMVAEKAWAKVHGSYEAIDGGKTEDALGYLTGGCTTTTIFRDRNGKFIPEVQNGELWKKLLKDHKLSGKDMGVFMSASGVKESSAAKQGHDNPDSEGHGLVSGHAYSVLDVAEVEGHQLINLRNPWGSYEWGGDWSDESTLWTESIKKAVHFVAADDGAFWMSFKDFTAQYSQIGICKTIRSTWNSKLIEGQWKPQVNSGGSSEVYGHFNPTFELQNSHPDVWIQFEQPDIRGQGKDWIVVDVRVCKKPKHGEFVNISEHVVPYTTVAERQKAIELHLAPDQGPYWIVCTAWAPGIDANFFLTVYSSGTVHVSQVDHLKVNAEQAQYMSNINLPSGCGTCGKSVPHYIKKSIKGVRYHDTPLCFKCHGCGAADIYDIGKKEGAWKGYCFDCWNPQFGDKCLHCGKPIQSSKAGGDLCAAIHFKGKIHMNCKDEWKLLENIRLAEKCFFCKEPIVKLEGKYSGRYFEIDEKGSLHEECNKAWKEATSEKCLHCGEGINTNIAKFSGRYFTSENGQVHEECVDAFNQTQASNCIVCSEAIMAVEGKFSGNFLSLDNGKGVHEECMEAYNMSQADKCIFCKNPVCKIEGKYSGVYYPIDGEGKLHEECEDAWRKN